MSSTAKSITSIGAVRKEIWLGYLDSNQEQRYQKPSCCQLHHTPVQSFVDKVLLYPKQPLATNQVSIT